MMSKERLEEIKQDVKMTRKDLAVSPSNEMTLHMDIMLNSMDYLIAQAEQAQELEDELTYYKMATESYLDMEQENKRYRKVFKEIRDLWHESTDATDDTNLAYTMARRAVKALECGE